MCARSSIQCASPTSCTRPGIKHVRTGIKRAQPCVICPLHGIMFAWPGIIFARPGVKSELPGTTCAQPGIMHLLPCTMFARPGIMCSRHHARAAFH